MAPTTSSLTPLMRASAIGHVDVVKELISEGVNVNERGPRNSTALMFAAGGGHLEVVKELVEAGANIEDREEGGWNACDHAVEDGHHDIIRFLVTCKESGVLSRVKKNVAAEKFAASRFD